MGGRFVCLTYGTRECSLVCIIAAGLKPGVGLPWSRERKTLSRPTARVAKAMAAPKGGA